MTHPLDNPAHAALTGPQAGFAERRGQALRYPTDVAPFTAVPVGAAAAAWDDVAALAGPGQRLFLPADSTPPPPDWEEWLRVECVQLTGEAVEGRPDPEAVLLTADDVPEILDLVARTKPGPFLARTVELGRYLGLRREGALVAMAGERIRPPGWTEVSAVCTDPAFRGQGLAARLVLAVCAGVTARGEQPFLHAASDNTGAVRLYESLGFRTRRKVSFVGVRVPEGS